MEESCGKISTKQKAVHHWEDQWKKVSMSIQQTLGSNGNIEESMEGRRSNGKRWRTQSRSFLVERNKRAWKRDGERHTETKIVPHVYPLVQYGIGESPSVTFGCLVDKYFPDPATISWSTTSGGTPTDVKTFPSAQIADPISYHRSSQVTVSKNDWESNTYLCTVSHNSSNYQTAIPKSNSCHDPLSAKLLQGSCPENSASHTVELVCQISNVISQNYQVKWFINGKEETLEDKVTQVGTSSYTRTVNVKQAEWNSGVSFMCQVHDSGNVANDTIRKCSDALNCFGINVFIMRPTVEDLFVHKIARITCLASNIPSNTGYQFRWFQGEEQSSMYSTEDAILNQNGTYSVSSVLTTSTDAWDSKTKYTCTFTDNMLRSPVIKTISKDLETKLFPPSVAVLPPTPEEMSLKERVTFTCVVHGFYPMDIYMGWSKDDIETPKELYVTSDPKVDNNQRYFAVSKMTVPFTDWDDDKPYTCVVGHEALPLYFTQRTIDKTTGKPTNVHVNVYMSDSQLSWP
ncbi:immunoglobulin heavy chain constant region [Pelobates cultripes]|nr:immunoglobulin heavy chain constant region [Pelobates cultripes]